MTIKVLHIATDTTGGAGSAVLRIHESLLNYYNVDSKVLVRDCINTKQKEIYTISSNHDRSFWYGTKTGRFIRRMLRRINVYISRRDFVLEQRKYIEQGICFTLPVSNYSLHSHPLVEWADIIHLHWIQDFLDFPSFFANVHKPILWTCHDLNPMMGGFHHTRLRIQYMHQWGKIEQTCYDIKNASLKKCKNLSMVALSSEMHQMLLGHEFFMYRNIYDIANCVDTKIFELGNKTAIRKKYKIAIDSYIVLFANGNLNDTEKGLMELVNALEILNSNSITLLCVGDGIIPESKISIIHLPRVASQQKMAEMYHLADLFVMPSHQEAFALTPIEAMSCGVPVVMTPVSGAKDLVRDFTGVVANDYTPEAIAIAISHAMDIEYNTETIRKHIIDNYTSEIIGGKYARVYQNIINIS